MMKFQRVQLTDQATSRLQDNVEASLAQLLRCPLPDGQLLTVNAANGANIVSHGLGRPMVGYLVIKKSANVNVWDSPSSTPDNAFTVNTTGTVTLTIWVF